MSRHPAGRMQQTRPPQPGRRRLVVLQLRPSPPTAAPAGSRTAGSPCSGCPRRPRPRSPRRAGGRRGGGGSCGRSSVRPPRGSGRCGRWAGRGRCGGHCGHLVGDSFGVGGARGSGGPRIAAGEPSVASFAGNPHRRNPDPQPLPAPPHSPAVDDTSFRRRHRYVNRWHRIRRPAKSRISPGAGCRLINLQQRKRGTLCPPYAIQRSGNSPSGVSRRTIRENVRVLRSPSTQPMEQSPPPAERRIHIQPQPPHHLLVHPQPEHIRPRVVPDHVKVELAARDVPQWSMAAAGSKG